MAKKKKAKKPAKRKKAKPKAKKAGPKLKVSKVKAAPVKCLRCGAPFGGFLSRLFGLKRSEKNPKLCNKCAKK